MDELNESQKRICDKKEGHTLVIAGPGTGKTYAISKKIASLIQSGIDPSSIFAITFTNRAALELKQRVFSLIGDNTEVFIGTIHKLGLNLMREYTGCEINVIDREKQLEILKEIIKNERKAKLELKRIAKIKNKMIVDPSDSIYQAYQKALLENNFFDYEDLILAPWQILDKAQTKKRITHIIVDEVQDVGKAQYELICRLGNLHGSFLCAVGDADQAIYGFRGADVEIFLNFLRDYPDSEIIRLNENYRSTRTIVDASLALIEHNTMRFKNVINAKKEGHTPIRIVKTPSLAFAGDFIVGEIEKRVGGTTHLGAQFQKKEERRFGFSDFAVLFRTKKEISPLKRSFEKSGIPYRVVGERVEGNSNLLSKLREDIKKILKNERDLSHLNPSQFFKRYPFSEEASVLVEMILELFPSTPIGEIVDDLLLFDPADDFSFASDSVTFTTIHRAKGLEFSCVFVVGLDEGRIPLLGAENNIEEERRLLYVAMTRAKEELFLIHSEDLPPSPFLEEIPSFLTQTLCPSRKRARSGYLFEFIL